jgi:hypothetical protein
VNFKKIIVIKKNISIRGTQKIKATQFIKTFGEERNATHYLFL